MKKIIAACIDQILEFDTRTEAFKYIEKQNNMPGEFSYSDIVEIGDGKYRIRVKKQYNSSPMLTEPHGVIISTDE